MRPRLAIVGRPNVGKSTLFNRLTGRRLALVDNRPGVTRDYREGAMQIGDLDMTLLDTAGLDNAAQVGLELSILQITRQAVAQADICLFLVDARAGILATDEDVAHYLRQQDKPVLLVANKCEGNLGNSLVHEAYTLGFGEPLRISAEHGDGIGELITALARIAVRDTTDDVSAAPDAQPPLRIAVVGRPNSGKSSLINRILGTDRLLTGPMPGVTRDAVSIFAHWEDTHIRIHDTAGMRKKSRVTDKIEKLSVADGLRAVRFAEIIIMVLDSEVPFESQDVRIADLAEREGRAVVFAANKWDLVRGRRYHLETVRELLERRLPHLRGAELIPVSAKTGFGIKRLHAAVESTHMKWNLRVSTGKLNRWLEEIKAAHPPPAPGGRRLRLRYISQIKARPPTFVIMCSRPRELPAEYRRYIKNGLRGSFGLDGVPIRIMLRSQAEDNPFV